MNRVLPIIILIFAQCRDSRVDNVIIHINKGNRQSMSFAKTGLDINGTVIWDSCITDNIGTKYWRHNAHIIPQTGRYCYNESCFQYCFLNGYFCEASSAYRDRHIVQKVIDHFNGKPIRNDVEYNLDGDDQLNYINKFKSVLSGHHVVIAKFPDGTYVAYSFSLTGIKNVEVVID